MLVTIGSKHLYDEAERKDNALVSKFNIYAIFIYVTLFFPTMLLPIMYAIAKFPKPDNWFLPMPAK